ncbi:MAG: FAD-dependent oxidoreductase [Bacteroidia bacterium]|nr:FAD-dependent oxidoreductase [Bacteroidia bacterium]
METVLKEVVQETDHVKRFFFERQDGLEWNFIPGQFVVIHFRQLPEFENTRSYSIASAPGSSIIELCISIKEEGKATPLLWQMPIGSTLEISEPQGNFIYKNSEDKEVVFICTGTGIAPFISMLRFFKNSHFPNGKITMIFGNKFKKDILYFDELNEMQKNDKLTFIPVLSREENWTGIKGHLHQVYLNEFSDGRDAHFYVCGWENMCKEARENLKNLGYNRRQYFFEQYD